MLILHKTFNIKRLRSATKRARTPLTYIGVTGESVQGDGARDACAAVRPGDF